MKIFDPIRQRNVVATPEEIVRQRLLQMMLGDLGYPKGLLAVEKDFGRFRRRADIVCYSYNNQQELIPLLVIECKAKDCTPEAREQALAYNAAIRAPFLCIAGKTQIHTLWLNQGNIASIPFLPSYCDLKKMAAH